MTKSKQKLKFLADLCNSNTLFLCFCETSYMMGSRIVKSKFPIFQSQEVTVTQELLVEYVYISVTQYILKFVFVFQIQFVSY